MSSNYEKAITAIKDKNGGKLPSDLYLKTNAELGKILYGLTGDIKHTFPARVSKETLVKRVIKLTHAPTMGVSHSAVNPAPPVGSKRSLSEGENDVNKENIVKAKKPRNVLLSLSQLQIVEMKRICAITHDALQFMKHEKDLNPLWLSVGMTSKYPHMTGKEKVMERMKIFAEANLSYHSIAYVTCM